ncbi:MAG: transporter [Thermoleophilia bacterium]|nr:transporter [Thermoleophilia bacterium]
MAARAPVRYGGAVSTPAIQLDALTKRFGSRTAVNAVTLEVPRGCVYGLVGPNGAGKTTLMRTMLGFTPASSGSATILEQRMPRGRAIVYPRIGVIIEEPRFYPFLTGRENLGQIVAARPEEVSRDGVDRALATVDLADRADDRVKGYSLGMRQRLGIARALLHDPELLILDEPSNGLDPPGIRDMRLLLRSLADSGRTVFVSSHQLAEMELMCDHVAVLKDGAIVAEGAVSDLTGPGAGGDGVAGATGRTILIGVTDVVAARSALESHGLVATVVDAPDPSCLHVTLVADAPADASATLNELLVGAGVRVGRLERVTRTLEQRFLEIVE